MKPPELRALRQLARELGVTATALDAALDCDLFIPDASSGDWRRVLRQMRRMMDDLGVNGPAAALLVRMSRDLQLVEAEMDRLRRLEAHWFDGWHEGFWRDLDE
jgi:hypothetical protein